jgi:hypothetical protein
MKSMREPIKKKHALPLVDTWRKMKVVPNLQIAVLPWK